MKRSDLRLIFLLIIGGQIGLFSCSGNRTIEFKTQPVLKNNQNKSVPLSSFLDFETTKDYDSVFISLNDGERLTELKYAKNEKSPNGYLLMLMRADKEHSISFKLKDKKGKVYDYDNMLSFTTLKLPNNDTEFPKIEITKNLTGEKEELTLINPRRRMPINMAGSNKFNQLFGMLLIINQKGEVLWYYQTDSRISDFDCLPNGNISYLTQDNCLVEIDFSGNIINQWYAAKRTEGGEIDAIPVDAQTFHHDVSLLPNNNWLVLSTELKEVEDYFTSEVDKDAPRKKQTLVGDVVIEFTPEGEVVHRWHAFDKMPVMRIGYETFSNYWIRRGYPNSVDWSHANAIIPLPNEDAYLINFRLQSAMIKVNKKSGEIDWIFAEPSGWGKDLQDKLLKIPEEGWNWHQHSPRFTKNGNLLFFNNNNYQARPFEKTKSILESPSYIVEYKIDEKEMSVKKIWSTENDVEKKVYSTAMGRVSELEDSGNILVCYGALLDSEYFDQMTWWNRGNFPQWTMVREYTHTENPKVVWEMQLHPLVETSEIGWTLFGAERIKINNLVY
jgi:arylsulfate sulfotransferase